MFAEKYARCDGTGAPGGNWWMRGIYSTSGTSSNDSYPGDRLSSVFGGGRGNDGTVFLRGSASKFLIQPNNFLANPGPCDKRVASSPHTAGMNVGLADGSVRFLSASIDPVSWGNALTPAGGEVNGNW